MTVHFGLSGRGRHEITASPAFVQRHASDIDLLALQWPSEAHRVGGDALPTRFRRTPRTRAACGIWFFLALRNPLATSSPWRGAVTPRHPLLCCFRRGWGRDVHPLPGVDSFSSGCERPTLQSS